MTQLYSSDDSTTGFDATTTGTLPTDWTASIGTWAAEATLLLAGHTHALAPTSTNNGDVALCTGVASAADMEVMFAQQLVGISTGWMGIGPILRSDSANNNQYAIVPDNSASSSTHLQVDLFKKVAGTYTNISTWPKPMAVATGDVLLMRAQCVGTTINLKIWLQGTTEPSSWDFTQTDSSITAAGYAGLYNSLGSSAGDGTPTSVSDVVITAITAGTTTDIAVATPTSATAGSPLTLSGTYAGAAPTGLNISVDNGSYSAISAPTISGGTWSGPITAPAAGNHTLSVQESSATTITGATIVAPTSPSETIAVNTPSTQVAGQTMTVSGAYTGGAPTALDYQFDSSGWVAAVSPTISGGTYSFSATAPTGGAHTVSVRDHNITSVSGTSGGFNVDALIDPSNAAIIYSPYTWNVQAGSAETINSGAYFSTLFTGTTCTLNFNVANMLTPASEIWWRIDNGAWTQVNVAASITLTIPAATLSNADVPYHLLEVVVKSTTETQNRWNTPSNTAVVLTGIVLDPTAVVAATKKRPRNIIIYGDSITEGVRTLGESAANDTDRNDATMCWSYVLGDLLGAEVGVAGFGGTGIITAGSGNVPALTSSYDYLYAGVARTFSPVPDMVIFNEGTNDGAGSTISAMTTVLNGIISACPGAVIAVLRPFNGNQATNLQSAIAACSNPSACHYIDTTGFFNGTYGEDSLSLHPSGPNSKSLIAPQIAAALKPLLAGSAAPQFRGGFQRGLLG